MKFKRHLKIEEGMKPFFNIALMNLVLLMLMFLVFNSRASGRSGVAIELPSLLTSSMLGFTHREIVVTHDNAIYWDNTKITEAQLKSLLAKVAFRKESILIKADTRASLGTLVEIWDFARKEGVAQVYIATD